MRLNEEKIKPQLGDQTRYDNAIWFLDIGASKNMTSSVEKFTELDTSVMGIVKFGGGSAVDICGHGTVLFEC